MILFSSLATIGLAVEPAFKSKMEPLIQSSCLDCHDKDTETRLNFEDLGHDLSDPATFRTWVRVHDQIDSGTMPPKKKRRPDPDLRLHAVVALNGALLSENLRSQKRLGRSAIRRLTRTEYEHTLHDLFGISEQLLDLLPMESDAGYDTLGSQQGISSTHINQYLLVANRAIDAAYEKTSDPKSRSFLVDYPKSRYMDIWFDKEWSDGGDNTRRVEDAIVGFKRTDFIWRTDRNGFKAHRSGRYTMSIDIRAYQARSPVTFVVYKAFGGDQNITTFLQAFDLEPGESRTVFVTAHLNMDEYFMPSFTNLKTQPNGKSLFQAGAKEYTGEGIAVGRMSIEGPLHSTTIQPFDLGRVVGSHPNEPKPETASQFLNSFAHIALRRPVNEDEMDQIDAPAMLGLRSGLPLDEAVRLSLRSLLTSPAFLYLSDAPGELNDHALAARLSYFLWNSLPDEELIQLADAGELSHTRVLQEQTDRMIDDPKFHRFVKSFTAQWLHLKDLDATTPDATLYPEFNDLLRQAMLDESELFLLELIRQDHRTTHLIDSDFTYLNRELAEHYDIQTVKGQSMRSVSIPGNSTRGGLLGQAAVHKVTANGTSTSPVRRGNFVLSQLLGEPSPPPPPTAGSIEPDIRGATTIRQTLAAHRDSPDCSRCHQKIDPPGFALESFDPIGGYRERYRRLPDTGKGNPNRYLHGLPVDASGTTADGQPFDDLRSFKSILLANEAIDPKVTRQLIAQLIVYATGAEIQFADRPKIAQILKTTESNGHRTREIMHAIIQSKLFTHK